jgi:hypothetical protein
MRTDRSLFFVPALAIVLVSCNSTFRVAGAPTFGRIQDTSAADIEAAVSAYKASSWHGEAPVGQIEVISHVEIRIYQDTVPGTTPRWFA